MLWLWLWLWLRPFVESFKTMSTVLTSTAAYLFLNRYHTFKQMNRPAE